MKKIYLIITGILLFASACFSQDAVKSDVAAAIKAGDVSLFSDHFHTSIDLSLPGIDNTVSKNQAVQILKDFFEKNPPVSYTKNHEGSSKDGSIYIIGTYATSGTKIFRTYFLLKKFNELFRVVQIQFEEQ